MKKHFRILSMLLAVCMAASLLSPAAWAASYSGTTVTAGAFTFSVSEDGTATLTGYDSMQDGRPSRVEIPASVESGGTSYPVTAIADEVFRNCSWLTSVTIPDSVKVIGDHVFEDTGLTSVTVAPGVQWGTSAFEGCTSLTNATVLDGVTEVPDRMFEGCTSLTSIQLPDSITTLGHQSFQNSGLTSIQIPAGVKELGQVFNGSALTHVSIPEGVTSIGPTTFYRCGDLTSVELPNTLTEIKEDAFRGSGLTSLTVPDSVTTIGRSAFLECWKLTSVKIGNGMQEIGSQAFQNCIALTDLDLGNSVTRLPEAFMGCTKLKTVTVPASVTYMFNAFEHCSALKVIYMKPTVAPEFGLFDPQYKTDVVVVIPKGATGYDTPNWRQLTIINEGDPIPGNPEDPENPENPEIPGDSTLSVVPNRLEFDSTTPGGRLPMSQKIVLSNKGDTDLTLIPPTAEYYTITPSDTTLKAGKSVTLTIKPKPVGPGVGVYDETVTLTTSQGVSTKLSLHFAVEGGGAISLSHSSLDFGTAQFGYTQPAAKTVTIRNIGDMEVTLIQPEANCYTVGPLSTTTLQAGQSATFTVQPVPGLGVSGYREELVVEAWDTPSASLSLNFTVTEEMVTGSLPFTDVPADAWYHDAVQYVYENKMMNGTSGTTFAPTGQLSRAMVAQVMYNMEGAPAVSGAAGFADVRPDAWYADAVAWASDQKIVTGYDAKTFGPEDNVTREQLAVMFYRYTQTSGGSTAYSGTPTAAYSDAGRISGWALDAMNWAVSVGLLTGKDGNRLDPAGTAARAELATILMRMGQQ